jgi:hypothetical protein
MKFHFCGLGLVMVLTLLTGTCVPCEAADVYGSRTTFPSSYQCPSPQRVQPVAKSETVTVPVPQPPRPCAPPVCGKPPYGIPPAVPTSRSMPIRVDIAVQAEACEQRGMVPVVYRDPGFLAPIIGHAVGLIGATIAAPFRAAEMLCPIGATSCPPGRPCGPPPCLINSGCQPHAVPQFAPPCPPARPQSVVCRPLLKCAPPGPSVAPLPPCRPMRACDVNLPPALVDEYQFPQCEPQDLLSGIWNLPGRLLNQGRLTGDMGRPAPGVPTSCRW